MSFLWRLFNYNLRWRRASPDKIVKRKFYELVLNSMSHVSLPVENKQHDDDGDVNIKFNMNST